MDERYVEAIEEGKIVRVTEQHALREGLAILRRSKTEEIHQTLSKMPTTKPAKIERDARRPIDDLLRPTTNWKEKQVMSELVENFHWIIRSERRRKGLTRRQLAKLLNESEENIQMLEFGRIPTNDFILINKLQNTLGIMLRKDGRDYSKAPPLSFSDNESKKTLSPGKDEIEIIDDD